MSNSLAVKPFLALGGRVRTTSASRTDLIRQLEGRTSLRASASPDLLRDCRAQMDVQARANVEGTTASRRRSIVATPEPQLLPRGGGDATAGPKFEAFHSLLRASGGCLVLDGGLATELERKGAHIRDPLWSAKILMEDPELIREVHMDYLEAGADVIISASYQATVEGFLTRGLTHEQAEGLLALSVTIAREVRDSFWKEFVASGRAAQSRRQRPLVAASVGPYAAYLADGSEYTGDYGPAMTVERLAEFHRDRLRLFASAGADLLAIETIPCKVEAEALVRVLEEERLGVPAWLSFNSNDGKTVPFGDPFAECVMLAENCREIVAVGANCTAPRYIESLVAIAREVTLKPILVYPNCGEEYDGEKKEWVEATGASDNDFVSYAPTWQDVGANLIGGCCRTTPQTVSAIASIVRRPSFQCKHSGGRRVSIEVTAGA